MTTICCHNIFSKLQSKVNLTKTKQLFCMPKLESSHNFYPAICGKTSYFHGSITLLGYILDSNTVQLGKMISKGEFVCLAIDEISISYNGMKI